MGEFIITMKKPFFRSLSLLLCCAVLVSAFCVPTMAVSSTPKLASDAACVIDADNGEILYQKNANRSERPASITKQMTALLVLEHIKKDGGSLDDKVTVTSEALSTVNLESTRIGFEVGQKRTVRDLMYCMLVYSANDAANILAEYVAGDVSRFVTMMNKKAKAIGCTNTHFENPNGLDPDDPSGDHHTTAHDMALISYQLEQYPDYFDFAGSMKYNLDTDKVIKESWQIWTKVDMILQGSQYYNKEAIAGKTGWTSQAHHTFVVYMKRGNRNLIIVTMNSLSPGDKYSDAEKLMDYCCNQYDEISLTPKVYQSAAEAGLSQIDSSYKLDTNNLPSTSVLLPSGLTANDLRYKVTVKDDAKAILTVGVAESGWDTYKAATHMSGNKAELIQCTLPLKQGLLASVTSGTSESEDTNAGGSKTHFALPDFSTPDGQKLWVAIGTALLVLISLIFLIVRFFRRRAAKKAEKQAHTPLQVVIKTPEQYQNKVEKPEETPVKQDDTPEENPPKDSSEE